jgi:hypothetical protein
VIGPAGAALLYAARVLVVDVGPSPAPADARAAIEAALQGVLPAEAALRDAGFGEGREGAQLRAGEAALAHARASFAALRCDDAERELALAEQALGQVAIARALAPLREVYRYRQACAAERGDAAAAAKLGALVAALAPGAPPVAGQGVVPLKLDIDPEGATVSIDGQVQAPPLVLAPGLHLIDVERAGARKRHLTLDVQPPGPMQVAVALAPAAPEPFAQMLRTVAALRGRLPAAPSQALAELATRAQVDSLLLVEVGSEIRASRFDARTGLLAPPFSGRATAGTVPGLRRYVQAQPAGAAAAQSPRHATGTWGHWYSWVIAGGLAALATLLVVSASRSNDELTIRVTR